jgi:hypothetical protein
MFFKDLRNKQQILSEASGGGSLVKKKLNFSVTFFRNF